MNETNVEATTPPAFFPLFLKNQYVSSSLPSCTPLTSAEYLYKLTYK